MKSTGITRKLDELGRIVIPKELRRTLGVKEGDPVEIFMDGDNIVIRPYLGAMSRRNTYAQAMCKSLIQMAEADSMEIKCDIFDTDGMQLNGATSALGTVTSARNKIIDFANSGDNFKLNKDAMFLLIPATGKNSPDMSIIIRMTYKDPNTNINKLKDVALITGNNYQNFVQEFC